MAKQTVRAAGDAAVFPRSRLPDRETSPKTCIRWIQM